MAISHPARAQRRVWDGRADSWDEVAESSLTAVVEAVLRAAHPRPGTTAVDLGSGSGQLSLPLARAGLEVTAVDVSPKMIDHLQERARRERIEGVTTVVAAVEGFRLPEGSVDLVVSNYALHHLRDRDKREVVAAAARWLRPGGRLVVGDMMFGRGSASHDRTVIKGKLVVLLRRGPAGWWRVMKNVVKFGLRIGERPVPMERWTRYFEEAGLTAVSGSRVVAEAAVVLGVKPQD
ncbi:MAG TPA: methyltransferase domain-containing protein [Acidimicrobiia bacterium]|nr:methyltransferase domain-containing protein [Acidimicrobiia bacterium]